MSTVPCTVYAVSEIPKTPVICKPFEEAFEKAFKIAGMNPEKTVRL